MKIGVYFCKCGTNIADRIDPEKVKAQITVLPEVAYVTTVDFICSEEGKTILEEDLKKNLPDRVVIAACSPREHEKTFMRILNKAGINPYLMQMVNIREQIAWVTEDNDRATDKAVTYIRSAISRVKLHEPLEKQELETCPDVLVIGAGPAGLKATLSLAEAGRKVVLVEKSPLLGGMPVRFEELFPNMECGPCMLEPILGDVFHGEHAERIEVMTMAEVVDVTGFYGNFIVRVKQHPRYVDLHQCIGCGECTTGCPASLPNEFNCNLNERKAIDFPFMGALPNAPFIDTAACVRTKGEECSICKDACPMGEGVIDFGEEERIVERNVGAVVVATGASLYDCSKIENLGYGKLSDIYTSLEFERILSSTGPTGGEIVTANGSAPRSIAVIHCVGSLDKNHREYCSGVCCQYALKFTHLIESKLPETKVYHFYRELVMPGKGEFKLCSHARSNPNSGLFRYGKVSDLAVFTCDDGRKSVINNSFGYEMVDADMVVLCPAMVPADGTKELGALLELSCDSSGFFEELHGRLDAAQSKIKGVYLAGTCQSPMDIQKAMLQGMAASGYILSGLAEGRFLEIEPITAAIDEERCAGCRICASICPYKAIAYDGESKKSRVTSVLCHGCGTCVAACPAGVIKGNHFTNEEIVAEMEGMLA